MICNDSVPVHIADELGIPVLAFYLPNSGRRYHPISQTSQILIAKMSDIDAIGEDTIIEIAVVLATRLSREQQARRGHTAT